MFLKIFRFFLFLWCLPQNIVGFIYTRHPKFNKLLFCPDDGRQNYTTSKRIKFIRWLRTLGLPNFYYYKESGDIKNFGVSLGFYICISYNTIETLSVSTLQHENGHRVQSALLGPFYLIFVGLTSLIHFLYHRLYVIKVYGKTISNKKYHEFFTESWADRLGSC